MNGRWAYFKSQYGQVRRFVAASANAKTVQRDVLFKKIKLAAESDFGRDHGLSSIKSIADFRRQLPISDYEYFRPYVDRVRNGHTGAMFGRKTRLLMFALTSGTTDKQKHIPVTNHFVKEYKRGWKLWGLQAHADHLEASHTVGHPVAVILANHSATEIGLEAVKHLRVALVLDDGELRKQLVARLHVGMSVDADVKAPFTVDEPCDPLCSQIHVGAPNL